MTHPELNLTDTIHRFELTINSSVSAHEKAFSLYGILIIPALLSANLMYNVFQLRNEYLTISLLIIVVILINVYFYYLKINIKVNQLILLIQSNYIQLMDKDQIYFQEQIELVNIEFIRCGKYLQPALKLSTEYFKGIIIGLKDIQLDIPIETNNQLSQPDYWLTNKHKIHTLMTIIDTERI